MNTSTPFLIQEHVAFCVLLRIAELHQQGGPLVDDLARVRGYAMDIASSEDVLYERTGRTRELAAKLVDAIAVLAFCPGSITMFGLHFEAGKAVQS